MKGRITDFMYTRQRRACLIIELADGQTPDASLMDRDLDVRLEIWRDKRSKDENAYFHVLASQIAAKIGADVLTVKRDLVVRYGTPCVDSDGDALVICLPDGVNPDKYYAYTQCIGEAKNGSIKVMKQYLCYKRSSEMNTAEMARLIDGTIDEARRLGIDTDTPQEQARKKSLLEGR